MHEGEVLIQRPFPSLRSQSWNTHARTQLAEVTAGKEPPLHAAGWGPHLSAVLPPASANANFLTDTMTLPPSLDFHLPLHSFWVKPKLPSSHHISH